MLKLKREQLIGRWRNAREDMEFVLCDDGSAETLFGDKERYPGVWFFSPPHQLLVKAVIPHNDPQIDDEVNAHEMCFAIRTFNRRGFSAEQFDEEGLQKFARLKELPAQSRPKATSRRRTPQKVENQYKSEIVLYTSEARNISLNELERRTRGIPFFLFCGRKDGFGYFITPDGLYRLPESVMKLPPERGWELGFAAVRVTLRRGHIRFHQARN